MKSTLCHGRYVVQGRFGEGELSAVLRATDSESGREVALKSASARTHTRALLLREARLLAQVDHPSVIPILDVFVESGAVYLVQERVQGLRFRDWRNGEELPAVLDALAQVASALQVLAERGIVHRDLKPENILVEATGAVRLIDFGLAILGREKDALTDSRDFVVGTVAYIAPEMILGGDMGPAADMFALGVVLFEAVMGHLPWPMTSAVELAGARLIGSHADAAIRELSPYRPFGLPALVGRMLDVDPTRRPTGSEVAQTLNDAAKLAEYVPEDVLLSAASSGPPLPRFSSRGRLPPRRKHVPSASTVGRSLEWPVSTPPPPAPPSAAPELSESVSPPSIPSSVAPESPVSAAPPMPQSVTQHVDPDGARADASLATPSPTPTQVRTRPGLLRALRAFLPKLASALLPFCVLSAALAIFYVLATRRAQAAPVSQLIPWALVTLGMAAVVAASVRSARSRAMQELLHRLQAIESQVARMESRWGSVPPLSPSFVSRLQALPTEERVLKVATKSMVAPLDRARPLEPPPPDLASSLARLVDALKGEQAARPELHKKIGPWVIVAGGMVAALGSLVGIGNSLGWFNRHPTIEAFEISPPRLRRGQSQARLSVRASDPEGDVLTYTFTASSGKLTGKGSSARWTAPGPLDVETVDFSAVVSDGRDVVHRDLSVAVNDPPVPEIVAGDQVVVGHHLEVLVQVSDLDSLIYRWTTDCGTLDQPNARSTVLTARERPGPCRLHCTVSDGLEEGMDAKDLQVVPDQKRD